MLNQLKPGQVAPTNHPERSPFSAGEWNRPLRLLIDDEEVGDCVELGLLRDLATRPAIEVYSTAGSTPYRARIEQLDGGNPDSWAAVLQRREDFERTFVSDPSVWQKAAEAAGARSAETIERTCQRLALASFWTNPECDAVVTGGKLLSRLPAGGGFPPLKSPPLALAEVGLCLRAHGDYVVEHGHGHTLSMPSSFHFVAAVGLLPSYPDWHAVTHTAWTRGADPEPYVLFRSAAERLGRALRALDYVRIRRRHPQLGSSWGELLFFFDALLLMLDGALDCLARFFHIVFGVPGSARRASWDKEQWLGKLGERDPNLAASPERERLVDVSTVVAQLRNTIHGAVLSNELHEWDENAVTSDYGAGKLLISGQDAAVLTGCCQRLGLSTLLESRTETEVQPAVLIDADVFACSVSREVLASINWLLSAANRGALPAAPPRFDSDYDLGPEEYRRTAALLAAIPRYGDSFSDALDIGIAQGAYRD